MNELDKFLNDELDLKDNQTIVIGLSGGPDSMALLNIIAKYNSNLKIVCAHVHHNLRKESDSEKEFVEKYCRDNGYIFEFLKIETSISNSKAKQVVNKMVEIVKTAQQKLKTIEKESETLLLPGYPRFLCSSVSFC